MSANPVEPVLKRKRIAVACNSCRARKSKCDGKRPICGRCAGYSYTCTWPDEVQSQEGLTPQLSTSTAGPEKAREILGVYEQLVQSLYPQLSRDARIEVHDSLAIIQARVMSLDPGATDTVRSNPAGTTAADQPVPARKYLGEISDVHFCGVVKQTVESDGDVGDIADDVDNYDPDELVMPRRLPNPLTDMPGHVTVEEDLCTYFSTIHFAYPFVSKPSFMSKLEALQTRGAAAGVTSSWLSLLYALLAIGAYYNSFRERQPPADIPHQKLFRQSLIWSEYHMLERSLNQASALLAQCFYLLATSQIDRCWASLGLAIRLAQSIGLHVNMEDCRPTRTDTGHGVDHPEMRARVWYSLYVLDRLLALQLGRPPAISDQDCHVSIPRRIAELELDDQDGRASGAPQKVETRYRSDYFTCVVEFSSIIGRVLRETYHPRRDMEASLKSTEACDKQLLEWKKRLPRSLRFDSGHVFEKSVTFKRQRNMLAIKFHHLRTLIHRPYLCYPYLKGQKTQELTPGQQARIKDYGNICVLEAQAIAHLMHDVTDTTDVVMNYPWWQIISCLVCAGSVMVLADAFTKHRLAADPMVAGLEEDTEICVQVLHALSGNSNGAKLAWDMMKNIRARAARAARVSVGHSALAEASTGVGPVEEDERREDRQVCDYEGRFGLDRGSLVPGGDPAYGLPVGHVDDVELDATFGDATLWPMVVPDSMNWPAEFLQTVEDPQGWSPTPLGL